MEIERFIACIVAMVVGLVAVAIGLKCSKNKETFPTGLASGIVVGLCLAFMVAVTANSDKRPTALDVYEGKTTLQITYRDSVPVDSIVVFKNLE